MAGEEGFEVVGERMATSGRPLLPAAPSLVSLLVEDNCEKEKW